MPGSSDSLPAFIEVRSASSTYQVQIRNHSFVDELAAFPGAAVVADDFFAQSLPNLKVPPTLLHASEENKALDASVGVIETLRKKGVNRRTEIVAVGGGIIQDISAFVASIYMRGLIWYYFPTTLLAMVDSCIGGKSSINVGPYKNLVGTYHPPARVLIDPMLAQTLTPDQKASGLIEAVKICFCRGEDAFERHLALQPSTTMTSDALQALIVNSLEAKKWFIEVDEFDQKERLLLNFGHTFGHAIEGATHFAVPHGIGVGLGILCAIAFERERGVDYNTNPRVQALEDHLTEMVSTLAGLSDHLRAMPIDDFFERFASDKKHTSTRYTLILIAASGQVALTQIERSSDNTLAIQRAVQQVVEQFS